MVVRGVVATIDITRTIRVVDIGKMVKPQYEAIVNLSLFATFAAFVAFLSHPTISKG
jgi:hypothetical protein